MGNSNPLGNNGGRFYSSLVKPVLVDCNFVVEPANANGLGISSLKGALVNNVFMHTSATPGRGNDSYLNPNPANGYALIQLKNNYSKIGGLYSGGIIPPLTGSNLAINATALTIGSPYVITAVGAGSAGAVTIAPVADTAGSLASTWFRIYDSFGNTFIVWFSVAGSGSAPVGVSGTLVQQTIASGATAAQVGAALVITLNGLRANTLQNPSAPNIAPFSAAGTTTVTVTNVVNQPFPGGPAEGAIATGFTFAVTKNKTNNQNWNNVGLPAGVLPALNASFIATAVGDATLGTSSGTVKLPGVSGVGSIEIVGDPNQSIYPIPQGGSGHVGSWVLVQFLSPTSSSVTTAIATAPGNLSVVRLSFYLEQSSVVIAGE